MALSRQMKKSTRSNTSGDCVEAGYADDEETMVAIGDTKTPGPRLIVTRADFAAFVRGIKAGALDR